MAAVPIPGLLIANATPALAANNLPFRGVANLSNDVTNLYGNLNTLRQSVIDNRTAINAFTLLVNNFSIRIKQAIYNIRLAIDQLAIRYAAAINPARILSLTQQRNELLTAIQNITPFIDRIRLAIARNTMGLDPVPLNAILAEVENDLADARASIDALGVPGGPAHQPFVGPPPVAIAGINRVPAGGSRFKESKKTRKNKRIKRRRAMKSKRSKSLQKGGYLYGKSRGKSSKHRINKSSKETRSSKSSKTTRSS
jgi:hypothetical protein